MKPSGVKVLSMYGPVPTGLGSTKVAGFPALLHMCWGRMAVPAMFWRLVYWLVGNVKVTVLPEVLTLEMSSPARLMAVFFFTRLKVKATSAGENAVPSFHLTPERIVKVMDLPPLPHAYFVASHG